MEMEKRLKVYQEKRGIQEGAGRSKKKAKQTQKKKREMQGQNVSFWQNWQANRNKTGKERMRRNAHQRDERENLKGRGTKLRSPNSEVKFGGRLSPILALQ